ncbi:MAG: ABC transporter substrate-binding protein [Candidatus Promineifilaceae bacterium]
MWPVAASHPALWLGLACLLSFLSACAAVVRPVVEIGLVAPFEGRHRPVGYDVLYSARLAVLEINQSGGVGDYLVQVVALDDSAAPELARQAAESLALDPAVVAVIGHWRADTTRAAAPVYAKAGLPLVAAGRPPLGEIEPSRLPAAFLSAYAGVTPFEETAGPWAGTAYDGVNLIIAALFSAWEDNGMIDRVGVGRALEGLSHAGLTGQVSSP